MHALQARPPFREHVLTPTQRTEALDLLSLGQRPQQVADAFGVRRSAVTLVSGTTSRTKILDVAGADQSVFDQLLAR